MIGPDAQFQLDFLRKIQRLFGEGQFTATYKFALLHALADLSVEKQIPDDGTLRVSLRELAEKFIELYWRHADAFGQDKNDGSQLPGLIIQNSGKQAQIITSLHRLKHDYQTLPKYRRSGDWDGGVKETVGLIRRMPLLRLQTIGGQKVEFLYREPGPADNEIVLLPNVAFCLRTFYPMIIHLVRSRWLEFIRSLADNAKWLGRGQVDLESFLFGSDRMGLARAARILREIQRGHCFYCKKEIGEAQEAVDHFVPWARYPHDLGHNFVLSHRTCNGRKSDSLAAREHVERWVERNATWGSQLAGAVDHQFLCNAAMSRSVALWSYETDSLLNARLWKLGDEYTAFDDDILRLLKAG